MKKLMKNISICLMTILCVCACFGCSCEKRLKIRYTASVAKENEFDDLQNIKLYMESYVEKKYREPASTPCYTKEGTLVTKDGVSNCYTIDGVPFEKATAGKLEKTKVEEQRMIAVGYENNEQKDFKSDYITMPNNKNYSMIYKFKIINRGNSTIYLTEECLSEEKILGGVFKEEVKQSGKLNFDGVKGSKVTLDGKTYYALGSGSEISVSITLKDLTNKDLIDSRNKTLDINFNLIIK